MILNGNISTGLDDELYFSYIGYGPKPKRSRISSSGVKLYIVFCLEISSILARIEKFV